MLRHQVSVVLLSIGFGCIFRGYGAGLAGWAGCWGWVLLVLLLLLLLLLLLPGVADAAAAAAVSTAAACCCFCCGLLLLLLLLLFLLPLLLPAGSWLLATGCLCRWCSVLWSGGL